MKRALWSLLLVACVEPLALEQRACPCLPDWRCCATENVCVPAAAVCPGPLHLDVSEARLPLLGEHRFSSDEPVSYAIEEPGGGSIDATGHYRAPFALDTFHLLATSQLDGTRSARIPLVVGPRQLDLFAGQLGGPGHADGLGADARFDSLRQLTSNGSDTLYLTQGEFFVPQAVPTLVRTISLNGSVASTGIVGESLAWLAGDLYVTSEHTIERNIGLNGSSVEAGAPGMGGFVDGARTSARFDHIVGLAAGNGRLWIAEQVGAVRSYDLASRSVALVAGAYNQPGYVDGPAATARFGTLGAIASDGNDGVLLADEGNRRLRQLSGGQVATLAVLDGDERVRGIAKLPDGTIVVSRRHALFRLAGDVLVPWSGGDELGALDGSLGAARFSFPGALTVLGDTLYVLDSGNYVVRAITPLSGTPAVRTFAGRLPNRGHVDGPLAEARFALPTSLTLDGDRLFVAEVSQLRTIDLRTRTVATLASDLKSSDIAIDADGTLYYSYDPDNQVRSFVGGRTQVLAGALTPGNSDGIGTEARFDGPRGLALVGGQLYVADYGNDAVRRIDLASRRVDTFATGLPSPSQLVHDGAGALLVTCNDAIVRLDLASGTTRAVVDASHGLTRLGGITCAPGCNIVYYLNGPQLFAALLDVSAPPLHLAGSPMDHGLRLGALPARLNLNTTLLFHDDTLLLADFAENSLVLLH